MDKRAKIQEEATLTIRTNKYTGLLWISPRVGKSKIVLDALNKITKPIKVLIVAPKLDILESWKQEIAKWGLVDNITVDFSWSNNLKKVVRSYELIICDEIHEYNHAKVLPLLRLRQRAGSRILGLTGTLNDHDYFHINNILSLEVIYKYTFEQAIEDGIIADYKITCIECNLEPSERAMYDNWDNQYKKAVSLQKYKSLNFLAQKRKEIIYNSKVKLLKTNELLENIDRCLVFTASIHVANQVGEASYHSKNKKDSSLVKFQTGEINKLSTVAMISLGITIPNLKHVIFNQLKSIDSLCVQQTMRSMNLEGNSVAEITILYLKNTQDFVWLESALTSFDKKKIKFI